MCDFTLAVPEAKFGYTEVRIGFVPAIVSSMLVWQVGHKVARDLLLTGRLFDAAEAHALGLVNEVVPKNRLACWRDRELRIAAHGEQPVIAVRAAKRLINGFIAGQLDPRIHRGRRGQRSHPYHSRLSRRRRVPFLEKRKQHWSTK